MDLFDFNHDGEVSDLERIMGLAAVLSEANTKSGKNNANNSTRKLRKLKTY